MTRAAPSWLTRSRSHQTSWRLALNLSLLAAVSAVAACTSNESEGSDMSVGVGGSASGGSSGSPTGRVSSEDTSSSMAQGGAATFTSAANPVVPAGGGGSGGEPAEAGAIGIAGSGASAGSGGAPEDMLEEEPTAGAGGGVEAIDAGTIQASEDAGEEGVADENGDPSPPRPMDVTAVPGRHEHRFRASEADPTVSFNDNSEVALFDNRAATLMGKLVLTFAGVGQNAGNLTGGGEFCGRRGFHVLGVAAFQDYNIVIHGPDFYGDARRTAFEGIMHTREDAFANIEMTPADGVAQRTQKALEYLHQNYPEEDWGYYLQEDGSVRWSDVIFTGMSHGASNSARFAFLVRASRVVSISGPRDNLCERVDLEDCGGQVATWFDEVPETPIERFFTITGVQDDQHTQHLFTMEKLGYVGEPIRLDGAQPPYGDSHRLISSGGHEDFCGQGSYKDVCNYVFGVPPENHDGTGP